jgi:DNA-directed RNA polymerase specialized sigma24 family protein
MPLDDAAEGELLRRAQAGDEAALDEVVERWYEVAVAFCRTQALRKGLDVAEGESVAYDALLEAIDTYKPEKRVPFKTWIGHKARGVVTTAHREWQRQTGAEAEPQRQTGAEAEPHEDLLGQLGAVVRVKRYYRDRDPDWPPKPPEISEAERHEMRIYAGIAFLCGGPRGYSWMHQRKGVDPDDQKLAKMLWTEYRPDNQRWRPLTRAEAATELGWDRAKVDRRVARIVKELTGKTEDEILLNRYGLGPFLRQKP